MQADSYHIDTQLTRYLTGECNPAEALVISGLINTDEAYSTAYSQLAKIWNSVTPAAEDAYDTDQAWNRVNALTSRESLTVSFRNRFSMRRVVTYVASVAAVLLIGFFVIRTATQPKPLQSFASAQSVSSPLALADGSHIVLNSNSELKFPKKFGRHSREVYFCGEAFFEIASDPTRPFVIETGDARVKVLGTSFNLKALPETGITEVVVNSGTVLFYRVDSDDNLLGSITLHKGDKGTYNHTSGKFAKAVNDDPNFISWKTGILVFNKTSLSKVMDVVGKRYNVNFHFDDPSLSGLRLTATFDNESLDSVLEVLQLVHKLQFTHKGNDYLVRK